MLQSSPQPASTGSFSVGLTGGIGSGKSTVADLFAALGAAVIDTDRIAHRLTAPDGAAMPVILAQFGPEFVSATGAMDRERMRKRIFSDAEAKRRLESILHPLIRLETDRQRQQAPGLYPLFVVPLLIESSSWRQRVDRILVVDCSEATQVRRVMRRNGLPVDQVRAIMAAQASRAERLAAADDVIVNEDEVSALAPQVEQLHAQYARLAAGAAP